MMALYVMRTLCAETNARRARATRVRRAVTYLALALIMAAAMGL